MRTFLVLITILIMSAQTGASSPEGLTFQGRIIKPNGTPLDATNVTLNVKILSPSDDCILLEENHTVPMSDTAGVFSVVIGAGSRTGADKGFNLLQVFKNSGNLTGLSCVTSGTTLYSAQSGHPRRVRITFNDGTETVTLNSDFIVRSVPYATIADSIQGKSPSDFMQVNTTGTKVLSQANLEQIFDGTSFTELAALIAGTSTQYAKTSALPVSGGSLNMSSAGKDIIVRDTPTSGDSAVNKDYVDTAIAGAAPGAHTHDAADVTSGVLNAARIPTGTDNTKLPLAGGTMTGALNMGGQNVLATGHITMSPQMTLNLGTYDNTAEDGLDDGLTAADKGKFWYNTNSNQIKFWNGTTVVALGAAGSGIQSFNGATGNNQTLQLGTAGNAPAISAAGDVHTINIPEASNTAKGVMSTGAGLTAASGVVAPDFGSGLGKVVQGNDDRLNPAPVIGDALSFIRMNAGGTAYEVRTPVQVKSDLGLGTMASEAATDYLSKAGNLSGLADASAARTNLGLGSMATETATNYFKADGSTNMGGNIKLNGNYLSNDGGNEGIRVDDNGNVGVGTASPARALHVSSAAGPTLRIEDTTNAYQTDITGNSLQFNRAGPNYFISRGIGGKLVFQTSNAALADTDAMTINPNGSIGIGTTSPGIKLDVSSSAVTASTEVINGRFGLNTGKGIGLGYYTDSGGTTAQEGRVRALSNSNLSLGTSNYPQAIYVLDSTGNVGLGTAAPAATALLDLSSTAKGFLIPRMTEAQRDAISSPATGLQVYNTDDNRINFYNGSSWIELSTGSGYVVDSRTISPGTGLTGGGDLTANRTLAVDFGTGAGKVVEGNDNRLAPAPAGLGGQFVRVNAGATAYETVALGTMATETAADYLTKAGNLSGLANTGTARTNLGATATGSALFTAADAGAGRTALGLGTASTAAATDFIAAVAPGTSGNVLTSNGSNWTSSALPVATAVVNGLMNTGAGLVVSSGEVTPDFGTGVGKVVQGNDDRLAPAPILADAGKVVRVNAGGTGYDLVAAATGDFKADGSVNMTGNIKLNGNYLSNDGGNEGIRVDDSGNVGVGTTPGTKLDVLGYHVRVGADWATGAARTDATTKGGFVAAPHYTNSEGMTTLILGYNGATTNSVKIGGGTTSGKAATSVEFFTAADNLTPAGTERMRINSVGNVGIGTASPTGQLHLYGSGEQLKLQSTTGSAYMQFINSGSTGTGEYVGSINDDLMFLTENAQRMRITSTGNVGIGTTTPDDLLHLDKAALNGMQMPLRLRNADNNNTGGTATSIGFRTGTTNSGYKGVIAYERTAAWGVGKMHVLMNGTADTSDAALTDSKLTVEASGNVGVGTTSPAATAILDLTSTAKGLLIPRMTEAQRDAISSPATGLQVYNTDDNKLNFYDGSAWTELSTGSGYVPTSRTVSAGTGLTGGGDLTANRSLAVDFGTGVGKVVQGNDDRLAPAPVIGDALEFVRINSGGTAYETVPVVTVTDGDKGDITVASTGTSWTIDNGSVALADMANIATASIIGRNTAGAGVPEVLTTLPNGIQDNITRTGTVTTGTWNATAVGPTYGGTGLTTATQGDLIYASGANTWAKLAKDTNATRYLSNTGASNNPA